MTNADLERLNRQIVDAYFLKTQHIIEKFGDKTVTYAIFLRRPVIAALQYALDWLELMATSRKTSFKIERQFQDGQWVGAGEPLLYITGKMSLLCDLETQLLMKIGPPCVAAYQACLMAMDLPEVSFIAMDARHDAGPEMLEMMAYAAFIGSERAKRKVGAQGFIGTSTQLGAKYFDLDKGLGTMPHALIGYAGSTLKAARLYHETFPDDPLTVLVDYFGREISDSLEICHAFQELAHQGLLSLRIDTLGGRFVEGLDPAKSYAVLERHNPACIRGYLSDTELKHLVGTGVTAAAIYWLRENLDKSGFQRVKIIASSGFSPEKCVAFKTAKAPVDIIGTGSFLPERWSETYATADIIKYNDTSMVKLGREFLFKETPARLS